jgi:tRNA threonylcarbamoyladenosine biosynthesis protein TsaB
MPEEWKFIRLSYTALFDEKNNFISQTEPKVLDGEFHKDVLEGRKIIFVGDGAEKFKPFVSSQTNALFADGIFPSARFMGTLSFEFFLKRQFEDIAYFEPYYLKEFYTKPL